MTEKQLLTARTTAKAVGTALRENNIETADRLITELLGRVIDAPGDIPANLSRYGSGVRCTLEEKDFSGSADV